MCEKEQDFAGGKVMSPVITKINWSLQSFEVTHTLSIDFSGRKHWQANRQNLRRIDRIL
jgi:hypothetical protein